MKFFSYAASSVLLAGWEQSLVASNCWLQAIAGCKQSLVASNRWLQVVAGCEQTLVAIAVPANCSVLSKVVLHS